MEDDFVVVANMKGRANIWRHFGLKKRKHDGTIWDKVAVCKTCNSTIKTSGCTTNNVHGQCVDTTFVWRAFSKEPVKQPQVRVAVFPKPIIIYISRKPTIAFRRDVSKEKKMWHDRFCVVTARVPFVSVVVAEAS